MENPNFFLGQLKVSKSVSLKSFVRDLETAFLDQYGLSNRARSKKALYSLKFEG
jgi:hypothetical protein